MGVRTRRLNFAGTLAATMLLGTPLVQAASPAAAAKKAVAPKLSRLDKQIGAAKLAIKGGKFKEAAKLLRSAWRTARRRPAARDTIAYYQATLAAYRGDYEAAVTRLAQRLPKAAKRPQDSAEFDMHNAMMMLREAQGDLLAAIVECSEMRIVGERGRWTHEPWDRPTQIRLKDLWHRAYLLRMYAEQLQGDRRKIVLRYARQAKSDYAKLARPLGVFGDSIAVLDAFFALHDGREKPALRAARRVDVKKNDDIEDLYLAAIGLEAGGDLKGADAVREKIRRLEYVSHARPIMLQWIERDAQARQGGEIRWTPMHPTGRP